MIHLIRVITKAIWQAEVLKSRHRGVLNASHGKLLLGKTGGRGAVIEYPSDFP